MGKKESFGERFGIEERDERCDRWTEKIEHMIKDVKVQ